MTGFATDKSRSSYHDSRSADGRSGALPEPAGECREGYQEAVLCFATSSSMAFNDSREWA